LPHFKIFAEQLDGLQHTLGAVFIHSHKKVGGGCLFYKRVTALAVRRSDFCRALQKSNQDKLRHNTYVGAACLLDRQGLASAQYASAISDASPNIIEELGDGQESLHIEKAFA